MIAIVALQACAPGVRAQTNTLVVPPEAQNTFGNTSAAPLECCSPVTQAYGSSAFVAASSDVIAITGVSFRIEETGGSLDTVVPKLSLALAEFPGALGDLDPFRNVPTSTIVYSGANVHLAAAKPGNPTDFGLTFTFAQPFVYDRRAGQLVLYFDKSQYPGGVSLDAQFSTSGLLFSYDDTDLRQQVESKAIVTQFAYLSVPEPRIPVLCLLSASIWLVAGVYRRRNQ